MQKLLNILSISSLARRCGALHQALLLVGALLALGAAPAWADVGFTTNLVYISGTNQAGAVNSTYYTKNSGSTGGTPFIDADLGTFNRTTARENALFINAEANTSASGGDAVQAIQLLYRVYRADGAGDSSNPIPLDLAYASGVPTSTAKWRNASPNGLDLLSLAITNSPGDYYLEVYFSGQAVTATSTDPITFADDNGGNLYRAKFSVLINGDKFITSSWSSTSDQNWFNGANWSTGSSPNSNTDVTIQYQDGISLPQIFDGYGRGPAQARNITLIGDDSDPPVKPLLEQGPNTRLLVYGNFQDVSDGFQQNDGVLELAGQNQTLDVSGVLANLTISGGGTKTLLRGISIANALTFNGIGAGILATSSSTSSQQGVTLQPSASLTEFEGAYILGLVRSTQTVGVGATQKFSNIGLELTPKSASAGRVTVTRTSYIYYGAGNSVSVQRGFSIAAGTSSLNSFDLTFHYLYNNLNGIQQANLQMFRSLNGRVPFEGLVTSSTNTIDKTLTSTGISGRLAATFTLGDINNPLPVELVSFTATGTAQGAALKWLTASEVNNKGFGIERQVAGTTTWQSVGYVDANNQANGSSYSFLDKTIPAAATQVYYRLRQEDTDGSLHYSPVATISRAAQGTDLTLSPVPLQSGPLAVSFAEAGQAGTEIVVLNMQGQRVARYTTATSTDGAVSLPLDNLAAGVYMVSVQVPGQATRHARFVKQ